MHSRTAVLAVAVCLALVAGACGAETDDSGQRRSSTSTTVEPADATDRSSAAPEIARPTSTTTPESQARLIEGLGNRRVRACLAADSGNNIGRISKKDAAEVMAAADRLSEFDGEAADYLREAAGVLEQSSDNGIAGDPATLSDALSNLDPTPLLTWLAERCSFIYRPDEAGAGGYDDACSGGEWTNVDEVADRIANSPDCRLYLRSSSTLCDVRIEDADFDEALRAAGAPDGVAVHRPSCWGRVLVLRTYQEDGLPEEGEQPVGSLADAYVGTYVLLMSTSEAPTKLGEWMSGQLSPNIPDPTTLPVTAAEAFFIGLEMI